jgi:hypothetical protein
LRANGSRECAPDDWLREAIHFLVLRGRLLRFARNDVEGPQRTEYPTYAGYEDSLAPRKLRQARQRKPGFTDASHAHVKKLFRVQIDND